MAHILLNEQTAVVKSATFVNRFIIQQTNAIDGHRSTVHLSDDDLKQILKFRGMKPVEK